MINEINTAKLKKMNKAKSRIAIFLYIFYSTSCVKNLIVSLSEAGYLVEVFADNNFFKNNLIEVASMKMNSNIILHAVGEGNWLFLFENYLSKKKAIMLNILKRIMRMPVLNKIKTFIFGINRRMGHIYKYRDNYLSITKNYYNYCKNVIKKNELDYLCFIGVEKKGLILAGKLSEAFDIPFMYYSLELFVEDFPNLGETQKKDRKQEIYYHQRAKATIVQDELRANALYRYNMIEKQDTILFPVSIKGKAARNKSNYLRGKYKLPKEICILFYFGRIEQERNCSVIAKVAANFTGKYMVIFHGYGEKHYLEELSKIKNVIISSDLVPEGQIRDVISSADIGLALYRNTNSNDRFTAFSSEKVALYLQLGIPIISMNNESYKNLFDKYCCGEMIDSIENLQKAADKIMLNIEMYKHMANVAYDEFYDYDKNVKVLLDYLNNFKKRER